MVNTDTIGFTLVGLFALWLLAMLSIVIRGSIRNYCAYKKRVKELKKSL
jgi:hypothetical protein